MSRIERMIDGVLRRWGATDPRADEPTQSKSERFAKGAKEIQQSCACVRWAADECIKARDRTSMDEICPCSCHAEIEQLDEELYGYEPV